MMSPSKYSNPQGRRLTAAAGASPAAPPGAGAHGYTHGIGGVNRRPFYIYAPCKSNIEGQSKAAPSQSKVCKGAVILVARKTKALCEGVEHLCALLPGEQVLPHEVRLAVGGGP